MTTIDLKINILNYSRVDVLVSLKLVTKLSSRSNEIYVLGSL